MAPTPAANAGAPTANAVAVSTACAMAFFRAVARFAPNLAGPDAVSEVCVALCQIEETEET
jgi:hypothetical protein